MSAFDELISHAPTEGPDAATPGAPLVVPLAGFYRRGVKFEAERNRFHAACRRAFNAPVRKPYKPGGAPGRSGQRQSFRHRHLTRAEGGKTVAMLNIYGGVVEYLLATDDIDDPVARSASDRDKDLARGWGDLRRRMARTIRDTNETAERAPLASPDWMKEPTGNSARPSMLSAPRLEALDTMGKLRREVPSDSMALIDSEILGDAFEFISLPSKEAQRIATEDLRRALDYAVFVLSNGREVTWERMMRRWPQVRRGVLKEAVGRARREK
ncbi:MULTISPECIES: hypothetical protein [Aurantimonas]|uniref:hypothetical protein n=1 Tax=Aurantimonas TaxID=182269 RepID=UPI003518BDA5